MTRVHRPASSHSRRQGVERDRARRSGRRGTGAAHRADAPDGAAPVDQTAAAPGVDEDADLFEREGGARELEPVDKVPLGAREVNPEAVSALEARAMAGQGLDALHVTDLAGIKLRGLDLSDIDEGRVKIAFPMRSGTFKIPTTHESALTRVFQNTELHLTMDIDRDGAGEPHMRAAHMQFHPEVVIENPASSLQPNTGLFGKLMDAMQDAAGSVRLNGLRVNAAGEVHVDGTIERPFPMRTVYLQEAVPENTFPRLDTSIRSWSEGKFIKEQAGPMRGKAPGLNELLDSLNAIAQRGMFELKLHTTKNKLTVDTAALRLSSKEAPVDINIKGIVFLSEKGNLVFRLPEDSAPEITSGAGDVDLRGTVGLRLREGEPLRAGGYVKATYTPRDLSGELSPSEGIEIPLTIKGADSVVVGKTHLMFKDNQISVRRGLASAEIKADTDGATLEVGGGRFQLNQSELNSHSGFKFRFEDGGLSINDGDVDLQLIGKDATFAADGTRVKIDGKADIQVQADRIRLSSARAAPEALGKIRATLSPRGTDDHSPLWGEVDYQLGTDGALQVLSSKSGVTEFIAPARSLRGNADRLVDPTGPAAGPIGGEAFKQRLVELTGAKVRAGTEAALLVDGVSSHAARLELIRGAEQTLFLQTLIFKGDQTGLETARELIAAAERGVDVRVIVDALGNVEAPQDLAEDKPLYDMLRCGGVKLELYNDPRTSHLGAALAEVLKDAGDHVDFGALLNDPAQALTLTQKMARIALGSEHATEEARTKVTNALKESVRGGAADSSVDHVALAAAADGDAVTLSEMMLSLREAATLNHRWHEKYLIADGHSAITGGMNVADEYLLGGTDQPYFHGGVAREAWRDTDVRLRGPAAKDIYQAFGENWAKLTGERPPPTAAPEELPPLKGGREVQFIQHHPELVGDHHITNLYMEALKACAPGDKAFIANAYFLPTGALKHLKTALIDAAQRGVDVRVLTNSEQGTDLPAINHACLVELDALLAAGVRVFERTGERTMHTKAASFGGQVATIGSWNMDNRSASLNSEDAAVIYDAGFSAEVEDMIASDMADDVAIELTPDDVRRRQRAAGRQATMASLFSDLM